MGSEIGMLATFEGIATVLATAVIAWFTVALASSTKRLWKETMKASTAALKTAQNMEAAERAYVKMSHPSPGVVFHPGGICGIFIQVQNFGRTPARVTDVVLTFKELRNISDLPTTPDYSGARETPSQAFLVTNDSFRITRANIYDDARTALFKSGKEQLLVLGYVDYIDQFGQRHRAGYGRKYNAIMDRRDTYGTEEAFTLRNNLDLITQKEYNYDHPRQHGESNDWDEPPN